MFLALTIGVNDQDTDACPAISGSPSTPSQDYFCIHSGPISEVIKRRICKAVTMIILWVKFSNSFTDVGAGLQIKPGFLISIIKASEISIN